MVDAEDAIERGISELENNAISRRQRLMQMRAKYATNNNQQGEEDDNDEEDESDNDQQEYEEPPEGMLLLRSYKSAEASFPHLGSATNKEEINTLEMKVTDQLIASKNIKVGDSLDLKTLAPRKVDWDLRRGISDKLEKLDRRTQKAVTQLIRNRMNEEGKGEESEMLAAAVGIIGE